MEMRGSFRHQPATLRKGLHASDSILPKVRLSERGMSFGELKFRWNAQSHQGAILPFDTPFLGLSLVPEFNLSAGHNSLQSSSTVYTCESKLTEDMYVADRAKMPRTSDRIETFAGVQIQSRLRQMPSSQIEGRHVGVSIGSTAHQPRSAPIVPAPTFPEVSVSSIRACSPCSTNTDVMTQKPGSRHSYTDEARMTNSITTDDLRPTRVQHLLEIFRSWSPLEPSALEYPFVPAAAPVGARKKHLSKKLENLVADFQNPHSTPEDQVVTDTENAMSATPLSEQFRLLSHTDIKSPTLSIENKRERILLRRQRVTETKHGSLKQLLLNERMMLEHVITDILVASSSYDDGCVLLESSSALVTVKDHDVFIFHKTRNMMYKAPISMWLAACLHTVHSRSFAPGIASPSYLLKSQFSRTHIFHPSQKEDLYHAVFEGFLAAGWTRSLAKFIISSPVSDMQISLAGNSRTSATGSFIDRGIERRRKRQKNPNPDALRKAKIGKAQPPYSIGLLHFPKRLPGEQNYYTCFFHKMDPLKYNDDFCTKPYKGLISLRRADRHMKCHMDVETIKRRYVGLPNAEHMPDAKAREDLWREMYIRHFRNYINERDSLNPCKFQHNDGFFKHVLTILADAGERLLPDKRLEYEEELRHQYYQIISSPIVPEHSIDPQLTEDSLTHGSQPIPAGSMLPQDQPMEMRDSELQQVEDTQSSQPEIQPSPSPPLVKHHICIQHYFDEVKEKLHTMSKGFERLQDAYCIQLIARQLKILEWLRSKVDTDEGVMNIITLYQPVLISIEGSDMRRCQENCPFQVVFNIILQDLKDALGEVQSSEDEILQKSQQAFRDHMQSLSTFNSCLMSTASLLNLVGKIASDEYTHLTEQASSDNPKLTRGTSADDSATRSTLSLNEAYDSSLTRAGLHDIGSMLANDKPNDTILSGFGAHSLLQPTHTFISEADIDWPSYVNQDSPDVEQRPRS